MNNYFNKQFKGRRFYYYKSHLINCYINNVKESFIANDMIYFKLLNKVDWADFKSISSKEFKYKKKLNIL